jgi:hypothetical protein
MAIALITSDSAGSSDNNGVTTAGVNTSGANLIVLSTSTQSSPTPTDDYSNTWTGLTVRVGAFAGDLAFWYCLSPSVGAGHTFSIAGSGEGASVCMAAFSGVNAYHSENGLSPQATNPSAGSVTPPEDGCLIVTAAAIYNGNASHATIGSPYTLQAFVNGLNSTHWDSTLAYYIQPTAGSVNPSWTSDADVAAAVAVFTPSAGGSAGQPTTRRWGGVPYVGGHGIGNKGSGRMWGRSTVGLYVPRRFAA